MIRSLFVTALAALALSGCGSSPENNAAPDANATGNSAAGNVAATVLGYSENVRNGVLARAIIDAKIPCGTVLKSERVADVGNSPAWRAQCKNGVFLIVNITADGTAVVTGAPNP